MNIDFFIHRPIFTAVCSFVFIVLGLIAIPFLPIAQYPDLAPPLIQVQSVYIGANADVVESAVTIPLEESINGVDGMKYIQSTSSDNGVSNITVTFEQWKDKDIAAVDVQNRVSAVEGVLPQEVKRTGYTISKRSTGIIAVFAFYAEKGIYDNRFISNYLDNYVVDELKRIEGVGDIFIGGERRYAMRIWLDPGKLAARNLTAFDVVKAVEGQNVQVPAGQIGQPPRMEKQRYQYSIKVLSRLSTPEEFNNLIIKKGKDQSLVKLKDIGYAELGSQDYQTALRFNTKEAVGLIVYQLPDANALQVYNDVHKRVQELAEEFPPGLKTQMAFETTSVIHESIIEVVFTLSLTITVVVAVIFIFLQSWRSTIIPAITIPVSLIGTFAFLKLFGYSINTLSMLGIVLATGLVVDDAIVVVENIQRNISEKGLSALKAASIGMKEVTSAVIASSLVLVSVFIPVTALPGTTGMLYREFALTIVFAIVISSFNALTLSPALSALLLRPRKEGQNWVEKFWDRVESGILWIRDIYITILQYALKHTVVVFIIFFVFLGGTVFLLQKVPTAFIPAEDNGYLIAMVQGPEGTSLSYTMDVMKKVEGILSATPNVKNIFVIGGFSFSGSSANQGLIFIKLEPLEKRRAKDQSSSAIALRLNQQLFGLTDAIAVVFEPPAIRGIGDVGGFQFELIDQGNHTLQELSAAAQTIIAEGNQSPVLQGLFTSFNANSPQLTVSIDREKAKKTGVQLDSIFSTIQIFLGSMYVNDFDFLNRVYRVYVQANENYRDNPDVLKEFYVRGENPGELIPLSNFIDVSTRYTAQTIAHFNLFRSVEINGSPATGYSSGQAVAEMQKIANRVLPQGMSFRWAGITLEQLQATGQSIIIFGLGLLFVYLVLSAQYESFLDPFIIIFAVPMAVFGALLAQSIRGLELDVFCQIGLVMLIGLASKNSILVVEFANQEMRDGKDVRTAIINGAKTRFRPVIMTSLSFIFGVTPLVLAQGAGAAARNSMGTTVFGGMFFATFLSLFIVPVIYLTTKSALHKKQEKKHEQT
jgi:HAE1 family hydrophobic/amphiphilic exporter-1